MMTEQETTLREALQAAYPAAEPSDALRQRIRELAVETHVVRLGDGKRQHRINLRLIGIAAALLIFAFIFSSRFNIVYGFQGLANSLQQWRERLGQGVAVQKLSPVITYHGSPVKVVIRDFQVNAKGDAFLLFTANTEAGRDIPFGTAELTNQFGTKYLDPSQVNGGVGFQTFLPTTMDATPRGPRVNGYLFGGEQLEGIRWIPLQTQAPWKPRHFRLTLHLNHPASGGSPNTVVFDLPVSKTENEVVPAYMPYMARPLSADAGVQSEEEVAARAYYLYHQAHALPQALAQYRKLIAIRSEDQQRSEKERGSSDITNAEEWFEVYHILTEMGRMEAAKAALMHAKKDADIYSFNPATRDGIKAAMKKLEKTP